MLESSLRALSENLHKGSISSVELTKQAIQNINNSKLNAFISVDEALALKQAKHADALLGIKKATPLTGIPMALKDLFCTKDLPTTCGSRMLAEYQSPYESTVSSNLLSQGAVLVGKTNMDEFAMGSSNENSYFGPVCNPWDVRHVPGGSSGGSAAAVAARLVPYAMGSDTGGSIRQPAAFCGISGIKPTYGLLSRFGMVAYASSLDQAGPLAKSAEDLAFLLEHMVAFDPNDSTSVQYTIPNYVAEIQKPLKGCRIGIPAVFFSQGIDEAIQASVKKAAHELEQSGVELVEINLNYIDLWVPCYYVIACAEASSNLSRYDGVRFGHRTKQANSIQELITNSRTEGFGPEVKRRILTGTHVLSSGYYDAYYLQALKIRRLIQEELLSVFKQVDAILGPTTPTPAFKIGESIANPVQIYMGDVFTVAANLAGLPALSIPCGFIDNLPIGLQLMGNHFAEAKLLQIAHQYQQLTSWHHAKPGQ